MTSTVSLLQSFFQFFRHERLRILGIVLLDAFGAGFEMIPPLFSILIFDYAFPQKNLGLLGLALAGGIIAYLIYFTLSAWGDYLNTKVDQRMTRDLSADVFEHIEHAPLQSSRDLRAGDLTVRLTDDTDVITGLLLNLPSHLIIAVIQLLIFFIVALFLDPWVTLLGLIALPFYLWETHFYAKKLERTQKELQEHESDLYEGLQEKLTNLKTIKAFNRQRYERDRLYDLYYKRALSTLRHKAIRIYNTFANSFILQIWTALITAYLGFEVIRGALSIGEMISLGIYLPMIQEPISDLARLWSQCRTGSVSLRRIGELRALPQEAERAPSSVTETHPDTFQGDIALQNLSFSYADNSMVLNKVDLVFPAKTMSAVVGPSGMGKSTVVQLLLRLYEPDAGAVLYSGKKVEEVRVDQLRRHVGVVFQEISLFAGTVRDNIRYGRPEAAEADVVDAARKANAHNFIEEFPQGYDTPLMAGGQNLSGGQRQRIALARTLLLQPSILILDEVTSALDAEAEFLIEEALERLRHEITIVLVTHNLATAKKADRIYYLDRGKVLEQGSFPVLMEKKGYFFDLYHLQMGGFQEFRRRLEIELERHTRYQESLSLIILEPDEYIQWREHSTAEEISGTMTAIAQEIRKQLRVMDFCAIYASQRIAIVLPQTEAIGAETMISRLLNSMANKPLPLGSKTIRTQLHFGVASCGPSEIIYSEQLFTHAEEDLAQRV